MKQWVYGKGSSQDKLKAGGDCKVKVLFAVYCIFMTVSNEIAQRSQVELPLVTLIAKTR